jgi:hypothetical protein
VPVIGQSETDTSGVGKPAHAAGEAATRTANVSDRIAGRLAEDQIFRQYATSFERITRLPLRLHSLRDWPPLSMEPDCGNDVLCGDAIPHFNRVFKKLTETAPGAYRQRAASYAATPGIFQEFSNNCKGLGAFRQAAAKQAT